ncbi:lytic transglycosylase domain-containing protein, partial [Escherichia coli]
LQERSRLRMVATGHRSPMTAASEREPVKPVATAAPVAQADVKTQAAKPTDKPAPRQQEEARLDSKSQGQA